VAIAKAQPGKYSFGSSGVGGATHVTAELFKALAGIDIVHVPYKGSGQMMADLLSGQVQIAFDQISSSISHVKAGKLRALGISTAKRSALLPDLPTIAEAGVPGYEATSWNGFAVRAGTPHAVIDRLQGETRKAMAVPEVKEKMFSLGIEPVGSTPEQFSGQSARRDRRLDQDLGHVDCAAAADCDVDQRLAAVEQQVAVGRELPDLAPLPELPFEDASAVRGIEAEAVHPPQVARVPELAASGREALHAHGECESPARAV